MRSDQEIDKALADEFSGYLKSISMEILEPLRQETRKQKSEIDGLTSSIDESSKRFQSILNDHHDRLSSEGRALLAALDNVCKQMQEVVSGVAAENEVTRNKLLAEASSISAAVAESVLKLSANAQGMRSALDRSLAAFHVQSEPWIAKAGNAMVATMESKMDSAEEKLLRTVQSAVQENLRTLESPLSRVMSLRYWLMAIGCLQVGVIILIWYKVGA